MLTLARKFTNYRLLMAGITQNKQKLLIFIVVPKGRKILIRLDQKEECSTSEKKNTGININKNNDNKIIITTIMIIVILVKK